MCSDRSRPTWFGCFSSTTSTSQSNTSRVPTYHNRKEIYRYRLGIPSVGLDGKTIPIISASSKTPVAFLGQIIQLASPPWYYTPYRDLSACWPVSCTGSAVRWHLLTNCHFEHWAERFLEHCVLVLLSAPSCLIHNLFIPLNQDDRRR